MREIYNGKDREYAYPSDNDRMNPEESLFKGIFLFQILPALLVLLSMASMFFSWMTIPEALTDDLNQVKQYVSKGSSFLEKILGSSEIAGIDMTEIEELMDIFSDGKLTPNEIFNNTELVRSSSEDLREICAKLKIENDATEALETLAAGMTLFRWLYLAVMGTGVLTIILILFRKKLFGNWFFTAAMAAMTAWHGRLIWVMNDKLTDYDIKFTLIPFIALVLSLPLIRYQRRKRF